MNQCGHSHVEIKYRLFVLAYFGARVSSEEADSFLRVRRPKAWAIRKGQEWQVSRDKSNPCISGCDARWGKSQISLTPWHGRSHTAPSFCELKSSQTFSLSGAAFLQAFVGASREWTTGRESISTVLANSDISRNNWNCAALSCNRPFSLLNARRSLA